MKSLGDWFFAEYEWWRRYRGGAWFHLRDTSLMPYFEYWTREAPTFDEQWLLTLSRRAY